MHVGVLVATRGEVCLVRTFNCKKVYMMLAAVPYIDVETRGTGLVITERA